MSRERQDCNEGLIGEKVSNLKNTSLIAGQSGVAVECDNLAIGIHDIVGVDFSQRIWGRGVAGKVANSGRVKK